MAVPVAIMAPFLRSLMQKAEAIRIDPSAERRILDFRLLGFHDVMVLGRYQYAAARPGLTEHCHGDLMEICYLERGKQTYLVGGDRYSLTGGDVFLTFPGEQHGTGIFPEEKGVLFWTLIRPPRRNRRFLGLPPALSQRLVESLLRLPRRHFRAGPGLGRILHRVLRAYDRSLAPGFREMELQNLLLRFLLDLLTASGQHDGRRTPEIEAACRIIAQHRDRMFSVKDLSRCVGMSASRLEARFRDELGIPPGEYVLRTKIDGAAALLTGSRQTVTEIAMALGFSTPQYFATVFKRYVGMSPSEFRTQNVVGQIANLSG